jgi:4-amino-4-deoxy-L-arabinose transferase-like glycosyltransferase
MNPKNQSNIQYPIASPWMLLAFLLLLTASHILIGYTSFGLTPKLWILFAGILAPMFYYTFRAKGDRPEQAPFYAQEFFPGIPGWVWALIFLTAAFLRFWQIDHLFCWPWGDEALSGEAAIDLSRRWDWNIFYSVGQSPPLLNWICAVFFKFSGSVFLDLWLPPALISVATMITGFFAARQFFSKSFTLVCVGLLAFSYWPLWLGRCCLQATLVPLGELLVFYLLGKFLRADPAQKRGWALVSGVGTGLLAFTYATWPVIAAVVILAVGKSAKSKMVKCQALAFFTSGLLIALIPFLIAVFREGYGQHLFEVSALNLSSVGGNLLRVAWGYLSLSAWGGYRNEGFYIPAQGGFLNPLLASLLCLGLINLFRQRSRPLAQWLMIAIPLFLLPGLLSLNVNGLRIVQVLPLLLILAAWGIEPLIHHLPRSKSAWLAGIFLFTAVFDMGRLVWPYQDLDAYPDRFSATGKSLAGYRTYQELEKMKVKEGPGIVLAEWHPASDRTLDVATYFWNAARHPGLSPEKAAWLGVVIEASYQPFLKSRFPKAQWHLLNKDLSLGIIPSDETTRDLQVKWAKADQAFRDVNRAIDHVNEKNCLETFDRDMKRDYPLVKGDPFLESCFWEKVGYFYYYKGGHYPEHLLAIQRALERGYPAAHLYYQLAGLLDLAGKKKEAREWLEKIPDKTKPRGKTAPGG